MFTVVPHTADLAIEVHGETLEHLFSSAADGWRHLLLDDAPLECRSARTLQLAGDTAEDLLVQWLSELNFLLMVKFWVTANINHLEISGEGGCWQLEGSVDGQPLEPHHDLRVEIKAVTYHQLRIERTTKGWMTRIIFDI